MFVREIDTDRPRRRALCFYGRRRQYLVSFVNISGFKLFLGYGYVVAKSGWCRRFSSHVTGQAVS